MRLAIQEDLGIKNRGLLVIVSFCVHKLLRRGDRNNDRDILRHLRSHANDLAAHMMRNLDRESGELRIVRKMRRLGLQYGHNHLAKRFLQTRIAVHALRRIRSVVVAGDRQHGPLLVGIEADGAQIGRLDLRNIDIQRPAQDKTGTEICAPRSLCR